MKVEDDNDRQLDELLSRGYAPLRQSNQVQRDTVLAGIARARTSGPIVPRRKFGSMVGLTAAALIVAAISLKLLWAPKSSGLIYGLEAIPKRLLDVETIRLRGWHWAYNDEKPQSPPVKVPLEFLIKRPGKFRHRRFSVSRSEGNMEIRESIRACDGQRISTLSDSEKLFSTGPVAPMDAWLKTENVAQYFIFSAVLDRPETLYKRIGQERIGGRRLDIYEARFENDGAVSFARLWFDPVNGFPIRKIFEEQQADGTRRITQEYDEISVNIPLDDELFSLAAPQGYETAALEGSGEPPSLDTRPTGGGYSTNAKLEFWHAMRVSPSAAVFAWRRSVPETTGDGTPNWLTGVEMNVAQLPADKVLRHSFLYQSNSPDVWNWSLVAVVDDRMPEPCLVSLKIKGKQYEHTCGMVALEFSDDELKKLIDAAAAATLPADAPRFSLADIQAAARDLSKGGMKH